MSTSSASLPLPIATPARSSARLWLQQACAWLVMVIAALDFCRWWAVTPEQARFKELIPMAPCTALGFAVLGAVLGLQLVRPARRYGRNISLALVAVVAVGGIHALFNRLVGYNAPDWELWIVPYETSVLGIPSGHLPPVAAGMFLLAAFGFAVLFPPLSGRGVPRRLGVTLILLVEACALATLVSYTAGNPPFANSGWVKVAPLAVFEFAIFSLGLLLSPDASNQLRQWFFGSDVAIPASASFSREERLMLVLLLAVGLFTTVTAVGYLRLETDRQRVRAAASLEALTSLKVGQIEQWRRERLGDARILMHMPRLAEAVRQIATGGDLDSRRAEFVEWLRLFGHSYGYAQIVLFDHAMRPLIAEPAEPGLSARVLRDHLRLPPTDDILELPPYVDETRALRWDLLVPLQAGDTPVGAVLLRTDPSRLLIPLVQQWPAEYQTGQSALWYREGDRFISLGGYRPAPDSTPEQRAPFGMVRSLAGSNNESMLTRAVHGISGVPEDTDYRGVMVIGVARHVTDSAWWLSSRIDSSEVYAPLRHDALGIAGIVSGLLATTSFATSWLWRQRQKNLMHQHLAVELEQKRLAARLGMVMRHAKDIICLVDQELRVVDANQQAVETYGWTKEEILRMRTRDFQAPETWATLGDLVERANTPDGTIFETVHQRKDRTTFPVEVAVRRVEFDGRPHMLAIIRDVTERKRTEGALRASQQRYQLIAENTSDVIWLYDLRAEAFAYISPSVFNLRGYRPEEVITQRLADSLTPASADEIGRLIQREMSAFAAGDRSRRHVKVEVEQVRKDGSIVPTEIVASLLQDASGA
ncbi:MAG TPA: PAS domain S-box protein, partial [Candidatus Didemnitutus sp.]|nr:PAS domain S-box protein [Candidatus Didemnitutus sp.]